MNGFINLNKPSGITSRDAVNVVRRMLPRKTKIGHAGTLDPLANGVLVIAVGSATRLIEYAQEGRKTYRAEFLLGRSSDTEDVEGAVVELENPVIPTKESLLSAAQLWTGVIMQKPPIYSALKINGQPAYKLARKGKDVDLAAREITIYSATLLDYQYPVMKWELVCSSGTYVRSWGRDVARSAGTEAVMSALTRTQVGLFRLEDSDDPVPASQCNGEFPYRLLPPLTGCLDLPKVTLTESQIYNLRQGKFIPLAAPPQTAPGAPFAGLDAAGVLKAILAMRPDGSFQAIKNLVE